MEAGVGAPSPVGGLDRGLYDYGARWYDPSLGRFIQPAPLVPAPGNPQALNRYAYVLNNPIRYTDPSGHWLETAWDIFNIGLTLNDIREEGLTWENGLALAVDVTTAILPGVPAFAGVAMKGGKAAARADDVLDLVRGVQWAERFTGAGPEVVQGIRYLEQMANSQNVWEPSAAVTPPSCCGRSNCTRPANSKAWR
ncbi:MAG: hypothetical protein KatS3mg051_2273 [Anaerolineae bacterium]|nr:MAG: hypothetical protein KatS3mg051_2273 [Anaerolineae bacterium]